MIELVRNKGQVKSLEFPSTWTILDVCEPPNASPSWLSFGLAGQPDVEVCLYYRGRPLAGSGQTALQSAINGAAGPLDAKAVELLGEVLRDASLPEAFDFWNVSTKDWNGRRVLIVEGRWNQLKVARFWLFVPADRDCSNVQEIWFQAPAEIYASQIKLGIEILSAIEWTNQ